MLDLGLHLDCLHLLDRGILTDTDRYVRSVTFWGIWSVDKEYSAMVGRPCSIRNVVITCPKPGYWALEDFVSGFSLRTLTLDAQLTHSAMYRLLSGLVGGIQNWSDQLHAGLFNRSMEGALRSR